MLEKNERLFSAIQDSDLSFIQSIRFDHDNDLIDFLDLACEYDKINLVKFIFDIQKVKNNQSLQNILTQSCLNSACRYGNDDIIKYLI